MFRFIQKVFVVAKSFFSAITLSATPLKCVSMNNQECKIRPEIVNVNSDEPVFYSYSVKISKCSGSCNNTNNPYAKKCVPDAVEDVHIKVFNLVSKNCMKTVSVDVDLIQVFVIINNAGMKINADVNVND